MQVKVDDILDLAKKEKGLYENLLALVEEEARYAREGNASALMDVLRRKQEIISRQEILLESWEELASSMGVKSSRETVEFWDILSSKLGEKGYQEVIGAVIEIREKAAETLRKETEVQKELEAHLEKLRSNLLKLNDGMRAFKAYTK
ncbi:flagellar biosynthesis protein FlgN [Acetomicrobium sp.]|uniref:flagellar biosynthesis protein FlgN n=1 Tax=Acetomicrobium sp. TaxID=1872099 RepID=UPI001BCF70CF|nr:flagellar biosynthesis protein FlgN [Acetomicrobium sp.]